MPLCFSYVVPLHKSKHKSRLLYYVEKSMWSCSLLQINAARCQQNPQHSQARLLHLEMPIPYGNAVPITSIVLLQGSVEGNGLSSSKGRFSSSVYERKGNPVLLFSKYACGQSRTGSVGFCLTSIISHLWCLTENLSKCFPGIELLQQPGLRPGQGEHRGSPETASDEDNAKFSSSHEWEGNTLL